jgi:hypothetical protein
MKMFCWSLATLLSCVWHRQIETLAGHGDAVVLLVQLDSAANKLVSLVSSFGRIGAVAVPALCPQSVVVEDTVQPMSTLQDMATAGKLISLHIFKLLLPTFFYYIKVKSCYQSIRM